MTKISDAGAHAAIDYNTRIPMSRGPFTPGTKGYGTPAQIMGTVNIRHWGAVGDTIFITGDVSIASGTPNLTVSGAGFTSGDVGKSISIPGAGAAGAGLITTIAARVSNTELTLAANASTTLSSSSKTVTYGTDDTAAIQAAISSLDPGGNVEIPPGIYRITSTLNLEVSTRIFGQGRSVPYGGTTAPNVSVIEASSILSSAALRGPDNSTGILMDGFKLLGPVYTEVATKFDNYYKTGASVGIYPGYVSSGAIIQDVFVQGFAAGIAAEYCDLLKVTNSRAQDARNNAIVLKGCENSTVLSSLATNSGYVNDGGFDANILIMRPESRNISILNELIDETGGTSVASLYIWEGEDIYVVDTKIYASNIPSGAVKLGDGSSLYPNRVTLNNIYTTPANLLTQVPSFSINITGGTGHVLSNVTTVPNGAAADIIDNGTGTTFINVNGDYKIPNLPTSDPAVAGTLWVDGTTLKVSAGA